MPENLGPAYIFPTFLGVEIENPLEVWYNRGANQLNTNYQGGTFIAYRVYHTPGRKSTRAKLGIITVSTGRLDGLAAQARHAA